MPKQPTIEDKHAYDPAKCLCHKKSFLKILTLNDCKCPLIYFIYLFFREKVDNVANQE